MADPPPGATPLVEPTITTSRSAPPELDFQLHNVTALEELVEFKRIRPFTRTNQWLAVVTNPGAPTSSNDQWNENRFDNDIKNRTAKLEIDHTRSIINSGILFRSQETQVLGLYYQILAEKSRELDDDQRKLLGPDINVDRYQQGFQSELQACMQSIAESIKRHDAAFQPYNQKYDGKTHIEPGDLLDILLELSQLVGEVERQLTGISTGIARTTANIWGEIQKITFEQDERVVADFEKANNLPSGTLKIDTSGQGSNSADPLDPTVLKLLEKSAVFQASIRDIGSRGMRITLRVSPGLLKDGFGITTCTNRDNDNDLGDCTAATIVVDPFGRNAEQQVGDIIHELTHARFDTLKDSNFRVVDTDKMTEMQYRRKKLGDEVTAEFFANGAQRQSGNSPRYRDPSLQSKMDELYSKYEHGDIGLEAAVAQLTPLMPKKWQDLYWKVFDKTWEDAKANKGKERAQ